ncbi:hypothetical protein Eta_0027 [Serratia phage Eta]|uniref:Uncharacterized protein n=1 Tax=Serratia phage Eta TaxID=1282995 RepID=R9VWC3_9CAUD|nr:hypothetical protein Eta_0027 [Serratia phage Eta]AGN89473.1 hypothetical protein Eta_0027 [Serratia phage Eta]
MAIDTRTNAEKSAAGKALNDRQRHYDRLHHMSMLLWLERVPCLYTDGEIVPEHYRLTLLRIHKESLRRINEHGSSTNAVSLYDANHLAALDEFEKTGELRGVHDTND